MASMPTIFIHATGEKVAVAPPLEPSITAYDPGMLSVGKLIEWVPEITSFAHLKAEQICNIEGPEIDSTTLIAVSQQVSKALDISTVAGVVVAHNIDTMEEMAFFLDLTTKSEKPVVVVDILDPFDNRSVDGRMKLLKAVRLAACPEARERGVMLVKKEHIYSARFGTDLANNQDDAFLVSDPGFLGIFEDSYPCFFYPPARSLGWKYFNVHRLDPNRGLPRVDIIYEFPEFSETLNEYPEADRIVLAGMGAGSWTSSAGQKIRETMQALQARSELPIVISYRCSTGYINSADGLWDLGPWAKGAMFLDPLRCRIQLQLQLATTVCGVARTK